jgi:hypothetical protein
METGTALTVKSGCRKYSPGYQSDLVCLLTWQDNEHPGNIVVTIAHLTLWVR